MRIMSLKRKRNRVLRFALALVYIVLSAFAWLPQPAAAAPSNGITVYVGYFGYDHFYKQAEISVSELYSLGTYEAVFSYIDRADRVVYDRAVGVSLASVLDYAGIDVSGVSWFYFYCSDSYRPGKTCSFLYEQRYFFPELGTYVTDGTLTDESAVWNGATIVEPMIALESKRVRGVTTAYNPSEFSDLSSEHCPRLQFGQQMPYEISSQDSAYNIQAIYVQLSGYPTISADNQIDLKVGSDHQIEISVNAQYSMIAEDIKQRNITWN